MSNAELMSLLNQAIDKKKQTKTTYQEYLKGSPKNDLAGILEGIVQQEEKHLNILKSIVEQVSDDKEGTPVLASLENVPDVSLPSVPKPKISITLKPNRNSSSNNRYVFESSINKKHQTSKRININHNRRVSFSNLTQV